MAQPAEALQTMDQIWNNYFITEKQRFEQRMALAKKIRTSIGALWETPDSHFGRNPNVSGDPVYQKLVRAAAILEQVQLGSYAGDGAQEARNWMCDIQQRTLKEKTYQKILNLSDEKVADWMYDIAYWRDQRI